MQASGDVDQSPTSSLQAGNFLVVRSIVRVLPQGLLAKAVLDAVIDAASAMQNLRTVVSEMRARVLSEPREDKRRKILSTCTVHLLLDTVAPIKFQTLFSEFWGELTHQACARTPKKWVKGVNI
jgi:hypothetical protein